MPDVTIKYSGRSFDGLSDTGSKTIYTSGKYCDGNFTVDYTKATFNLQSKSVQPQTTKQTITPDSGYDGLSKVTVLAMSSGSTTQNAPTVNASTGLVTATSTVTAGYQAASTKSNTLQLTTQAAQTITPTTTDQTIAAGKYLTGAQTIKGDANLVAANIKNGVTIFNVTGTGLNLQAKNATPSATSQTITPDTGYDGLSRVDVSGVEVATMEEVQSYLGMDSVTPSVTMISFTVSGRSGYATYQGQAEDGMTWADWVESEYNTGNFSNEYFYIRRTSDSAYYVPSAYVTINSNAVLPSDTIVDDEEYGLASGIPEYYGGGND